MMHRVYTPVFLVINDCTAVKQNYEQNLFSSRMPGTTTPEDIMANLQTTDLRIMYRKQVVALGVSYAQGCTPFPTGFY